MRPVRLPPSLQRGEARPAGVALLLLVLAVSWLLWSGIFKPLLLALGAFSCILSAYLASRMGFFRHKDVFRAVPGFPGYLWWLLREIVVSSFDVARRVLSPSLPVSPTLVELDAGIRSDAGQVILGNSITLSPGTVTLDLHRGRLLVHCLTRESAAALSEGENNRRVARLGLD
jgi:multicomponent Na+:H+ antiporter subunit E